MTDVPMNLTNHFLIAMPSMDAGLFAHSITYICEHNPQGAMGLVINRPLELTLQELFDQLTDLPSPAHGDAPVYGGGPVQVERGFILHNNDGRRWDSTLVINDEIALTTSKDILDAIARNQGPKDFLISLGYAGWDAGQLEQELTENAWLTLPADSDIIFKLPVEQRVQAATRKLGINFSLISSQAGHA